MLLHFLINLLLFWAVVSVQPRLNMVMDNSTRRRAYVIIAVACGHITQIYKRCSALLRVEHNQRTATKTTCEAHDVVLDFMDAYNRKDGLCIAERWREFAEINFGSPLGSKSEDELAAGTCARAALQSLLAAHGRSTERSVSDVSCITTCRKP